MKRWILGAAMMLSVAGGFELGSMRDAKALGGGGGGGGLGGNCAQCLSGMYCEGGKQWGGADCYISPCYQTLDGGWYCECRMEGPCGNN